MKFSTLADQEYQKSLDEPDKSSSSDKYFRPNQIENNQEIEFVFLDEDPLEYWQVFGEHISDGSKKPFRFPLTGEAPSNEDILKEMGGEFRITKVQYDNDKLNLKANISDSPASHCYVWPIWNCEAKTIQIFEVSQPSIFKQIKKETGLKKYRKGVGLDSDFSCTLHKVKEGFTKYTFNIIDRDDDLDIDEIEKQWKTTVAQGFDITLLIYGDDPFNPN